MAKATIMINLRTHRDACLYGCESSFDAENYDLKLPVYLAFLRSRVESAGFDFDTRDSDLPASYSVLEETGPESLDEAYQLMESIPSFWEWF